jgi:putative sigma-54 modulation protein
MQIIIKTKNFELTPVVKKFIEGKIKSLEKLSKILYNKKYFDSPLTSEKYAVEVFVEIGKTTKHHKKGVIFFANIQMKFPQKSFISKSESYDLKLAVGEAKEKLKREVEEYKMKLIDKYKRRLRILKKNLKISPEAKFYSKDRIIEEEI